MFALALRGVWCCLLKCGRVLKVNPLLKLDFFFVVIPVLPWVKVLTLEFDCCVPTCWCLVQDVFYILFISKLTARGMRTSERPSSKLLVSIWTMAVNSPFAASPSRDHLRFDVRPLWRACSEVFPWNSSCLPGLCFCAFFCIWLRWPFLCTHSRAQEDKKGRDYRLKCDCYWPLSRKQLREEHLHKSVSLLDTRLCI